MSHAERQVFEEWLEKSGRAGATPEEIEAFLDCWDASATYTCERVGDAAYWMYKL